MSTLSLPAPHSHTHPRRTRAAVEGRGGWGRRDRHPRTGQSPAVAPPPPRATPRPGQSGRGKALWGRGHPQPSACREDQGCWVFSASMSLLSERSSLASLVPSVQWGQLTISGRLEWGRSGAIGGDRAPNLGEGEETRSLWWEEGPLVLLCASPPPPHPPAQRPPASLSCFCFSQPQVETSPGLCSHRLDPRAGGVEARSLGSSQGLSSLLFPLCWEFPILWAQGRGLRVQRPGSSLPPHGCLCEPRQSGALALGLSVPKCP